jgi:hypothetical protein
MGSSVCHNGTCAVPDALPAPQVSVQTRPGAFELDAIVEG